MSSAYGEALSYLRSVMNDLGMTIFRESSFGVDFAFPNEWILSLVRERYGDGIFLYLVEPVQGREFHLWLLMVVFSKLIMEEQVAPTLFNQISFFERNRDIIFGDVSWYSDEYDKMNNDSRFI